MDTVNKYEEVSKYFPLQEWKNLPEYEKNRFHNLLINYNKMCELGFSPRKPDFMLSRINKTRIQKLQKESDEEWTPNKVKRPRWNPPRKLAGEVPSVEQKIEDQPFVQFNAADVSRSQQIYHCLLQKIAELRKQLGFEDVPEYQLPTQHRYPRRQIERKDYREKEVPDDDDYIYCDECEREWEGDCPEHGALVNVPDTKVPGTVNGPDRAEKTVPKELCIAQSSIHNAGKGVWTRVLLQKGLRFGPYEGVKVDSPNGEGYCWQIRRNQRISHYVDAWDSSKSNWMRYVNCARHEEEQNLIAFQYKGEMYYRTFRTIQAHVELLVWYGDDFGRELGINKENYHKPLRAPLKSSIFPCISCNTTYCSPVYLHNHFRYCRMRTSTPSRNKLIENERVWPWQCNNCKCFGNSKHVSFLNSGSKMNKKQSKNEENGTPQLLRTEKKCVERTKNDYLSCMDVGDKSRGIPSKCAKIISLTESLDRREVKCMKDAPITTGGPRDNVSILRMQKNITTFIYPGQQNINYNDNYRPQPPSDPLMLGTKLDECSPLLNMLDLNFTLKHRNICKISKNLSFKTGIPKCDNIYCIKTYYERQSSNNSTQSLNAFEWPCNCKQCNKVRVIVSKLHIKEKQSAVYACGISSKSNNQEILEIHETSHSSEKLAVHNAYRKISAENDTSSLEKDAGVYTGEDPGTLNEQNLQTNSVLTHHTKGNSSKRSYVCKICNKKFLQNEILVQHDGVDSVEGIDICSICNKTSERKDYIVNQTVQSYESKCCKKGFHSRASFAYHSKIHFNEGLYPCTICNKVLSNKASLSAHLRVHTGEKSFQGTTCGKAFSQASDLTKHRRIHTGDRPYQCTTCDKAFSQAPVLTNHLRIHTGEKPYQCTICNKAFSTKVNLSAHNKCHTGERPYQCNICNKAFSHKGNLSAHVRSHTGEKPYQCIMCNKAFSKKVNLSAHNRCHTGERPYQCNICNKEFSLKGNLSAHVRRHTGEKPYQCIMCSKAFSKKVYLSAHNRCHTGERPYQCNICNKAFSLKENLSAHIRCHTGVKSYQCNICNKAYSQKGNLSAHIRNHADKKSY